MIEQTPFWIGIGLLALTFVVLIIRFIGAWMLRINEVINELKKINEKLS